MSIINLVRIFLFLNVLLMGALFIKTPTGKPLIPGGESLLSLLGLKFGAVTASELVDTVKSVSSVIAPTKTYYQWKDDKGQWQFSDSRPAQYHELKIVTVRTDANVMRSADTKDNDSTSSARTKTDSGSSGMNNENAGPYNGALVDHQVQGKDL